MIASGGGGKANYRYYRCTAGRGYLDHTRECNNRSCFRGDYVDDIAWSWIVSIFLNPEELETGYQLHQAQLYAQNEPVLQQLELAKELLSEHQEKLDRLLDLYLAGDIDREMLIDRKSD